MKTVIQVLIVLGSVFLFVGSASAETEAERLYKAGADAYFRGDYSKAIINFKRGNDLDPNAMFLYNLALAYAKLGNLDEAAAHAQQARDMGLPAGFADKNSARITAFSVQQSAQNVAKEAALEKTVEGYCESHEDCESGQSCTDANTCVADSTDDTASGGLSTLGWTGVGVAGTGVVLLGVAIVVDLGLTSDIKAYDKATAEGDNDLATKLLSDIEDKQSLGKIILFSGIGLAATGAALIVYDVLTGEQNQTAWVPFLQDGHAGIGYIGRF